MLTRSWFGVNEDKGLIGVICDGELGRPGPVIGGEGRDVAFWADHLWMTQTPTQLVGVRRGDQQARKAWTGLGGITTQKTWQVEKETGV